MSSWVMSIVINSVKMQLRKTKRNAVPLDYMGEDSSVTVANTLRHPGPNPEQIFQSSEIYGIVTRSIRKLSPTQRMSLQLFELGGLSLKEAAETLGVPLGTVKAQLARGRERLRKTLGKVLGAAGDHSLGIHSRPTSNLSRKSGVPLRANSQPASLWTLANAEKRQKKTAPIKSLDVIPEDIGFVAMEVAVQSSPVPA